MGREKRSLGYSHPSAFSLAHQYSASTMFVFAQLEVIHLAVSHIHAHMFGDDDKAPGDVDGELLGGGSGDVLESEDEDEVLGSGVEGKEEEEQWE